MTKFSFRLPLVLSVVMILTASACSKKTLIPPPPPPPPLSGGATTGGGNTGTGRPVIAEFSVEPSSIERGQSAVLRWNVTGANNVAIDHGIGTVAANGTQRITPNDTTTYNLTANGPAGEATGTATVTVTGPAASTNTTG